MEGNMYQTCLEPQPCGSDNERASTYSSKDGSCNYDQNSMGIVKSEYLQFGELYRDKHYGQKSSETNNSLKKEKMVQNRENDPHGPKKRQLFKCPHCPKVFSNSSAIAKHKLTHSDERKYACDTCGKAFKRQDHLNGHKHTHTTNKPHACHLCDRSYSDARSLRRHYENQHQNEFLRCKEQTVRRDSGGSSVDESGSVDVFGFLDETKSIKCDVCGKGFKNQSALNGHMRLHGGYGQAKDGITGPGEQKPVVPLRTYSPVENRDLASSTHGNRPSSVPSSSRASTNIVIISTVPNEVTHSQLHSLLTRAPSTATHDSADRDPLAHSNHSSQGFGRGLHSISSAVLDTNNLQNISMDDLCKCLSPPSTTNATVPSRTLVDTSSTSYQNCNISDTNLQYSQPTHYSPITPAFVNHTGNSHNDSHMFTYPAMVDGRDLQFESTNHDDYHPYNWDNTHSPYISTNPIQKQWTYFDSPLVISEVPDSKTSNQSFIPRQPSSSNLQDLIMNLDSIDPCTNLDLEWSKFSEGNEDQNIIAESSESESITKKEIIDNIVNGNSSQTYTQSTSGKVSSNNTICAQSIAQEPTISSSHKKNKCRPAPIFIPPQTSAHMSRLRSPRVWNATDGKEVKIPPYTPPPMLSPQRKGSGLFHSVWYGSCRQSGNLSCTTYPWTSNISNNPITVMSNSYCNDSLVSSRSLSNAQISSVVAYSPVCDKLGSILLDSEKTSLAMIKRNGEPEHFLYQDDCQPFLVEESDGLPTSATPRINIGPQYQAKVPAFYYDKRWLRNDRREWDTLLWDPKQFKETMENTSSLDLLMKIASSPAVKSCGLNMEYTFHLLCKFKGDLEKTLQALLEDSFVVYDYVYAETTNWTTEEINKFQERLKKHDRDFMRVALDLQSCGMNKSVKACVEFYYVWKQMNNVKDINRFRIKSSRKKSTNININSLHDDVICAPNIDGMNSTNVPVESGYNLRKKFPSGNQKVYVPYSYGYNTSSDNSSHEHSPVDYKPAKTVSNVGTDRVKKPQIYHCSQCKKRFTKSKTLENHLRSHKGSNLIRDKLLSR